MAFRLDKAIVRGEISNEVRGIVTGKIWLLGRTNPLVLELEGNCLRDLAGCTLRFENPVPRREHLTDMLQDQQLGVVGDMTASRKGCIPTVNDEELMDMLSTKQPVPHTLVNLLYLEWFSQSNGRVVIESSSYKLDISPPTWQMTPQEEKEQARTSKENFFQFLNQITGEEEVVGDDDEDEFMEEEEDEQDDDLADAWDDDEKPLDEFEWEKELREADRRAAAYQEAFDRYKDHPDRERLIAEAMRWDAHDDDEDEYDEDEYEEDFEDADMDGVDAEADAEGEPENHHPLSRRAMRLALRLQEDAEERGIMAKDGTANDHPLLHAIVSVISLGGKLAAALDPMVMGYDPDPGFIIAMLKRSQIPLNEALHSLSSIDPKSLGKDAQIWLATARSELFDLRKDVLDLMAELRTQ